ncbi:MAG: tetratricopeptide repeat protein [Candidatus Omnitrophota bacterium]|jgi:tetratricopeptide (TPR) repeat protein
MNRAGILLVILLVLAPLAQLPAQEITAGLKEEETLFMGKKAFEDGFYEVSLGLLERFLNDYPDSLKVPEAQLLAGECYFQQNKFMEALTKFEALLKDPKAKGIKDAVYYWTAEVHFKGDNFAQAVAYYKKIIQEFPNSSYVPIAYYSIGWCLFQEHKFQDALGYFQALAEKFPGEPQGKDAAFKMMECLYNLKDYPALKSKIAPLFGLFSEDSLRMSYLYFYLGEANYYLDNFSESIEAYSKSLASNPDEKMQELIKLDLAWAYLKLKRYKEAEDIFWSIKQKSLEERSRDILFLGKAILCMDTNRVNEAKKIYEQLLSGERDPLILAQAYIGRADAFYNLADYKEASRAYQEALSEVDLQGLSSQIVDKLYYNLSWSLLKQGNPKAAVKEFQKVADTSNDLQLKVSALCQIGDIYQESGDYKKAQKSYQAVLEAYPDNSYSDYVRYQLGSAGFKDSDYKEAILSLEKFQDGFKESGLRSKALYLLGNCFYNLGDYAAARRSFKEVIRSSTQDIELIQKAEYGIADCFYQSGEEGEALKKFKVLRSKYPDSIFTPEIIWWLGRYYYQHSEPALAARYFLSLVQDFPKSDLLADAYYVLGLIFIDSGQPQKALRDLKKALDLNKPDIKSKAAVAMAGVFFKTGNYDRSLDYYRKGLEGTTGQELAGIRLKIAEALEAKGKLEEAIKEYLEVVRLSGQESNLFLVNALLRLGQIYEDRGDTPEALDTYNKISKMNVPESRYAEERLNRIRKNGK